MKSPSIKVPVTFLLGRLIAVTLKNFLFRRPSGFSVISILLVRLRRILIILNRPMIFMVMTWVTRCRKWRGKPRGSGRVDLIPFAVTVVKRRFRPR